MSVKGLYPPEETAPAAPVSDAAETTEESVKEARSPTLTPATKKSTTTVEPSVIRVARAVAVLPEGTTDDTPDFDREQVMLDIPDQLFGNSFTMVTSISKIFGDFMLVSQ